MIREINFDGIIGPSHNYAGLSHGNLAATRNAGATAYPRRAALEGVAKMRANLALGLTQGILLPHDRPNRRWLAALSTRYDAADPVLQAQAMSASAMWAANAATVSPAPDTGDGRCHLTVANLVTMPHRSHEAVETLRQLRLAFADPAGPPRHRDRACSCSWSMERRRTGCWLSRRELWLWLWLPARCATHGRRPLCGCAGRRQCHRRGHADAAAAVFAAAALAAAAFKAAAFAAAGQAARASVEAGGVLLIRALRRLSGVERRGQASARLLAADAALRDRLRGRTPL